MFLFTLSINPVRNVLSRMYLEFIRLFGVYSGKFMVIFLTITRTETLSALLKSYVTEGQAQVGIGVNDMCRYKRVVAETEIRTPKQRNSIGRSMTASPRVLSPSSVFSTTFISLIFHSRKEKFGTLFKILLFHFLNLFFNAHVWYGVTLSRKWGCVCVRIFKSASFLSKKNLRAFTKAPQGNTITKLTLNTKRKIRKCFYTTFE